MSYRLKSSLIKSSEKRKRNKSLYISFIIFIIVIILFSFNVGRGILFSIGSPILSVKNYIVSTMSENLDVLRSKESLIAENRILKEIMGKNERLLLMSRVLQNENEDLKALLGRKNTRQKTVLSAILSKPPLSPYDTLIIDIGSEDSVSVGNQVMADGNTFIGYISETYSNSSKVVLYSSPDEKTNVIIGNNNIEREAVGVGGGNFRLEVPREVDVKEGDTIIIPSVSSNIFGVVEKISSKDADSFQTVLFKSPVNINELKWVEVVLNKKN